MDLAAIRDLVEPDLKATDELIEECLRSDIPLIKKLSQHLIHSGGKRLRPLLVLLCAKAFSYPDDAHIKLAAIIELIHTVTLLHDDVVDASELRRGKKTANALWGNAASVLVGDFLYSRAFQLMVDIGSLQIINELANATNTISEGEVLQLLTCKDPETSEECYMKVIRAKTGTLFATATKMGPLLCRAPESTILELANYGMHLGVAFQLVDDALDYCSTSQTLGKNCGDDLAEGKPTLPLIHALQNGTSVEQTYIRRAIENASRDDLELILTAIESTGAIAYTYHLAKQHADKAISCLSDVPDSPYRKALIALAEFSVARKY